MHIEATDVTKTYGDVTALAELSLSVPSGSTFGLLGTNGAGKTTLFRLLIGHERPDSGQLRIGETDVAAAGPRIRERVGYLPERAGFPAELTGREVLEVNAAVRGLGDPAARVASVIETVRLTEAADRAVAGYSHGMGRRLGLATALLPDPAVLLLDEPTAGLDPLGVVTFHRIVADVGERTGATVLVCSHALAEVERLCDRVAVLDGGRLRASGSIDDLASASDARQIRIDVDDPERRRKILERCRDRAEVSESGVRLTVEVPESDAVDLLADIEGAVGLDGVELRERGLEPTFRSLVENRESAVDGERSLGPATDRSADSSVEGRSA